MFKKYRALVIDDDELARRVLRKMLEHLQFGAVEIASGAESAKLAFHGASDTWPNLILCDFNMKPTNGIGFVSWMKSRPEIAALRIPVILVTAHADPSIVQQAMIHGLSGYIVKPFNEEALRIRIQRAIHAVGADPQSP